MLLRPDLEALLAGPQKVVPNEAFFRLLVAVHQLDNLAIQWCGGTIGQLTPLPPLPPIPSSQRFRCPQTSSLRLYHLWLLLLAALYNKPMPACICNTTQAKVSSAAASVRFNHWVCAGRGQAFAGAAGGPMLLPVVEDWVKGVRSNQLQWSARLLGQEQWQPYSSGQVSWQPPPYMEWLSQLQVQQAFV